jgi:ligand-binding sensor domain-containing protein
MQNRLTYILFFCLAASSISTAQNVLPIGAWRSHLPYQSGDRVTQSSEEIYYATPFSIMVLDKEELSTRFLATTEGLSNTGISFIRYNQGSDILIIVYENSVIDLYEEGDVTTLNQIKNFLNIPGDKAINDIFVLNDSTVYLAASYGVSALNVRSAEFTFTTFTGIAVNSVAEFGNFLYMATDEGIYRIAADDGLRENFERWEYLGESAGFPSDYSSQAFVIYDDRLFLDIDNDLYYLTETAEPAAFFAPEEEIDLEYLSAEGTHLLAGFRCNSGDCSRPRAYYFTSDGTGGSLSQNCLGFPYYALEDEQGRVWFGDGFRFFRRSSSVSDPNCTQWEINSPYSQRNWDMTVSDGKLWVAAGALDQTLSNRFVDHGFYSFEDGDWDIYNRWTRGEMRGEDQDPNTPEGRSDDLFDILSVAVTPHNGNVYAGSFLEGIMEVTPEDEMHLINEKKSPLQTGNATDTRVRIGGMAVDDKGDLWVSNHSAQNGHSIAVLRTDGNWQTFGTTCGQRELFEIEADIFGNKWAVIGNSQAGLLVFNEGNPEDDSDDQCRVISSSNSNLPTNTVNCVAPDLEGNVWVGTDDGVVIFECGSLVFDPEICLGTLKVVTRDGFGANLLETENVTAIAIDGANRKWVGTSSGLFLLSEDGEDELAYFTTSNSPLYDNEIQSLAIDQESGEVFIGTAKGIISYQGDAVAANQFHSPNILVYPNPVRPEYDGPIAVKGLAENAIVKITDVNGKLVYETTALGGQAIWDGRDYNGRRANSGVYLVFSSSNPFNIGFGNPDSAVAKILFIN